ncbi:ABC transporter ATP-binding protein [Roseospira navarrensis]|uniref:ATP-binding cassette domain-containing protein n=1 Tax=Roseospira navarrensis TaxID=140058 RepID=A0A7X2D3X1_9PROT|nr:ABC transporter ATP-binding protein [Roseospira navarrensis]MQX37839.1 ATP-binding cassette domain-containing protein [Roseospira navarrensis]
MNDATARAPALALKGIRRAFKQADAPPLTVLDDANLTIRAGEIVALVGPSGSGKSTLLQIAGLLERPDSGEVLLGGEPASGLGDGGRTALRRRALGFVYQYHHLLPEFSAEENVIVPQMVAGKSKREARGRARDLLARMGLEKRGHHRPGQLSGGEQQRVAIARALANAPRVLLADEPTGNLDPHTADAVFAEFMRLVREEGLAGLIATHNPVLAQRMDRVVTLRDGRVEAA